MVMKVKKQFRSGSLMSRQLRTFLTSFIFPSFVLIVLLFSFFISQTFRSRVEEQKNTLKILSSHLTAAIDSDLQMSLAYLFNNDINYFYNLLSRTEIESDLVTYNQRLHPYTKAVSNHVTLQNENIIGFGFYPCNHNTGLYFYIPKYRDIEIHEVPDLASFDWYQPLQEKNTSVIFTRKEDDPDGRTLSIVRAAKNVDMGMTTGYIVVDISMDFLYNLLDTLSISPHSGILLFSPSGEFLFSTNDALSGLAGSLTAAQTSVSYEGSTYDIQNLQDDSQGFAFYYLSSRWDLFTDYFAAFLLVLFFYLLMVVIAVLTFRYNSRRITASVTSILETMKRYNGGQTDSLCDTASSNITEFRVISDNLNQMIQKINLHIANEYKLKIEQQIAEYQALQAEVDPHFLYNTLNLFISLNRIGAKAELEQAIFSLSRLFRYTCEHTSHTTVGAEFAFIQDYLFLQKIRYDERLEFNLYIEPELENFRIPKLLIQPLVENAIIHALEPSALTVTISLSAITVKNKNGFQFTVISVTNTGLPYIEEEVPTGRVGLRNVKNRLELFNSNSFFFIGGGHGKPTKCYIIIPIETNEVNDLC